jgi:hypothetical protein
VALAQSSRVGHICSATPMLILKSASKSRPSSEWSADDYDVFEGGPGSLVSPWLTALSSFSPLWEHRVISIRGL